MTSFTISIKYCWATVLMTSPSLVLPCVITKHLGVNIDIWQLRIIRKNARELTIDSVYTKSEINSSLNYI